MTWQGGLAALAWLAVIVVLIPLALWLLKRTPLGGGAVGPAGTPRTVAVLPLTAQQRLVTVEVGTGDDRRWLVVGVSPQGLTALHTLPAQADVASPNAPPQPPFAQLLTRFTHPRDGAGRGR